MKSKFYIFAFFILLTGFSCQDSIPCYDELSMFEAHDSIPRIKLENGDTRDKLISKFQAKFGKDMCYSEVEFALQLSNETITPLVILNCPSFGLGISRPSEVRILINQQKQILINSENSEITIDLDSINHWIAKEFQASDDGNLYKKEIAIYWSSLSIVEDIEFAAIEILKGINAKFDLISNEKFDKRFCQLNQKEILEVTKIFPYRLVFKIGLPPPPPPPMFDTLKGI